MNCRKKMNKYIKNFEYTSKDDVSIAGGKGASLGEMIQNGIPVPSGFVVLASAFDRFLEETDLIQDIQAQLDKINYDDASSVNRVSKTIRDLIADAEMPKDLQEEILKNFKDLNCDFVAVRSSATAEDSSATSWAGELESYLNTTENNLLGNVKKCWSSLFTPRAIFYRKEKDLHGQKVSVAVVVQKMIESEVSGVAFSVHPVTEDPNQLIIEAGFGLGEAIVSGQITPDSYVVEKDSKIIINKNISKQKRKIVRNGNKGDRWDKISVKEQEKQKLSDDRISELAELVLKIENHYGIPQDIEWAFNGDKFYIMQSRPITTLS